LEQQIEVVINLNMALVVAETASVKSRSLIYPALIPQKNRRMGCRTLLVSLLVLWKKRHVGYIVNGES
jgi:hypothetical protein